MKRSLHSAFSLGSKQPPRRTRGGVLMMLLAIGAGLVVLGVVVIFNALTLTREARVLRGAMLEALDVRPVSRIQLSVGPVLCGSARAVLAHVEGVPEEARLALRSVRAASVGVYRFRELPGDGRDSRLIDCADEAMGRCGWSRIVGVMNHRETVAIYAPTTSASDVNAVRLCVAVCNARELVIVSAKADPANLAELVARHRGSVRL